MSGFDDLLNLGDSSGDMNQSGNPFDPIQTTNQSGGSADLLGLGFGDPISTQNGSSAKVNFETNTNPLYELSNNDNIMESETNNQLLDFGMEPQKEVKMDAKVESSGNPLYDYMQAETTNGHGDEVITNGGGGDGGNEVDLLGLSGEVAVKGGSGAVTSDDSGVTLDSSNMNESNPEPELLELEPEREPEPEEEQEREPEPEPEAEPEAFEPEQQKQVSETVEQNGAPVPEATEVEAAAKSTEQIPDQEVGPAETDQGDSQAGPEEPQEIEPVEAEQKVVEETQESQPEKVDEVPAEVVETTTVPKEEEPEPEKAPEVEAEEVNDDSAEAEAETPVATEVQQETIPENEAQEQAVENKDNTTGTAEKPGSPEPEPSAAESAPEEIPEQKEAVADDPPTPVVDEVDQAELAAVKDEPVQPETEQVQLAESEPTEAEPQAFVPVEVEEAPAEVEQPETVQDEIEQVVSEPVQAAPEPEQAEQAASEQTEVEEPATQPAEEQKVIQPEAVEQVETEPKLVEEPEVIQPEMTEQVEAEPKPVEEQATAEPEAVQQTEAEKPLPESGIEEQAEAAPEPVPEPAVEEEEKSEEVAPVATESQSAESTLQVEDQGNEDQKAPESPAAEPKNEVEEIEPSENGVAKLNGTNEVKENGLTEEEAVRDPTIYRETREKEEIHFAEMNNFRQKFESGQKPIDDKEPEPKKTSVKDEYDEGGEFENEPVQNPDVVKETDQPDHALPEAGTAKNLLDKFKNIQEEKEKTVTSQNRVSPPRQVDKVEYESTPTERLVIEEGKSDMGEFESTPATREDVIRSGDVIEDATPEKGYAKNIMNKFKDFETSKAESTPREQRELTPDASGKTEYVSEPRSQKIEYEETRVEAGVFENEPKGEEDVVKCGERADEVLPESGMAKNLLSKFKQMESEVGNRPPPTPKRDVRSITPDRSGKVEYTSEPRGTKITYEEQKEDQGVFESKPAEPVEVVRSGDQVEEVMPEAGSAKKTMERYKEMQKQSASPVSSTPRKEFTPPREGSPGKTVVGVVENTPSAARDDVVRCVDGRQEEYFPEEGSAKNILNKFKEIQTSSGSSPIDSPSKRHKEFTPPPESGVYENKPTERLVIEEQQTFEGVMENTPSKSQADVARDHEHSVEKELPESGMAKNLVSKFRQLETTSAKTSSSSSPRFKEFTPPRDRGPLSPKSPAGQPSEGVNLSDLPSQYQQQTEKPGVFENEPEVRPDVYREADTDWQEGLPAANTTMSMLQKFKSIQQQAKDDQQTPAPISRKDDTQPSPEPEEKGMFKVVQTEKCDACQKTVYAMEKLEMNSHIYHKNCFKCSHCSARLTPKTFSMNEGVIYCVNHFKQLFARKGNYDEGFGRQQYKKKWNETKKEMATA